MAGFEPTRRSTSFDFDWRFLLGDPAGAEQATFTDSSWRTLDLPHDWSIEGPYDPLAPTGGPGGYLPTGIGWYRKTFTMAGGRRDQRVAIQFDGIYQHSRVWINGHEVGSRPYGYSSFVCELTPYLADGPNVVAVRVDNSQQPNSRWYSGSGIYRHTWLLQTDRLHLVPWKLAVVIPRATKQTALLNVSALLRNDRSEPEDAEVTVRVLSGPATAPVPGPTPPVAEARSVTTLHLGVGAEVATQASLEVPHPSLWSPDHPSLYVLRTEVRVGGELVDQADTPVGIRTALFDVDRGLLVNGEPVKMRGVCIHQDGGAVGVAVPEAVLERRLRLLQEMGCNAIRCSHYPMAPEFYDLCDRLGLLVLDEAFDEWTIRKPQLKFGYSDVFADWYERDVTDLVDRDRNHPSVVMWNAGNEIGEQDAPEGPAVLQKLIDVFHREDPTRPVTAAMDNIFNQLGEAPDAFTTLLDVVGYNYVDRWGARRETQYSDDRLRYPHRRFIGTEETSVAATRGKYEWGSLLDDNDSEDILMLGHGPPGPLYLTAGLRAAALWKFTALHDYVIGEFIWTGIDYLGESKWPRKLTAFGALDTCGFKKDSFYFYQSIWTSAPMVHLLPHWTWPGREGTVVPVVAYTNCAAVELFLNGKSLGVKAHEFPSEGVTGTWNHYEAPKVAATTADLQLAWDAIYSPGELRAVGYDRQGRVVATETLRTAGAAARLEITVDRTSIVAGIRDVAAVTIRALDASGTLVPAAANLVTFSLTGPGRLIGVDNGDPESHASYQGNARMLFGGMALALVQSTAEAGPIRLTARAEGMPDAVLDLSAAPRS